MGKQKSIVKIQGSIDDMTFYQMNGISYVRKKTAGPSKEKIKTDPRFKRTRENNQEFAGAVAGATALRQGLVEVTKMLDNSFRNRAMIICRQMIASASGTRGQRPFKPQDNKGMFQELVLQKSTSFQRICNVPYVASVAVGNYSATLAIPDFNTGSLINPPPNATHFKMFLHISVLSEFDYDIVTNKYQPVNPELNTLHAMSSTDYLPLGGMVGAATLLQTILGDVEELPPTAVLVVCMGIEFYQSVTGGGYYSFASNDAMKIVLVK
ncbi:MAG TPA: hypothetical protein VNW06_00805 [Cytophagaceae bacterium]|jgi:hypothetical protein|nr:hypothetical protein [Cytophagaceae bacterium]